MNVHERYLNDNINKNEKKNNIINELLRLKKYNYS